MLREHHPITRTADVCAWTHVGRLLPWLDCDVVAECFEAAHEAAGGAVGFWLVYQLNMTTQCGTGGFWDYPQIGMTQDAVLLTRQLLHELERLRWREAALCRQVTAVQRPGLLGQDRPDAVEHDDNHAMPTGRAANQAALLMFTSTTIA